MTESDLKPFSLFRHPKTGGNYLVLGVAICSTNGKRQGVERSVVYWSFKHRALHYREVCEFLDGRFEGAEEV